MLLGLQSTVLALISFIFGATAYRVEKKFLAGAFFGSTAALVFGPFSPLVFAQYTPMFAIILVGEIGLILSTLVFVHAIAGRWLTVAFFFSAALLASAPLVIYVIAYLSGDFLSTGGQGAGMLLTGIYLLIIGAGGISLGLSTIVLIGVMIRRKFQGKTLLLEGKKKKKNPDFTGGDY